MNTKKIFYGLVTVLILIAASCTPNTADDDQLYEQSLDKEKVILKR